MSLYNTPIVHACYLNPVGEMYKVRLLGYFGEQLKKVVVEDSWGNIRTMDINTWQNKRLIPFCYTGSDVDQLKFG